jgi:hypothetical protein
MVRRGLVVLAVVALAASAGACGTSTTSTRAPVSSTSSSTTTLTTATPRPTTTTTPTAAVQLAPFFAAARTVDRRLRTAAARINGGIDSTTIRVDQRAVDAVNAADPSIAARVIPAGLPEPLQHAVFLVYSDLSSRRAAFNRAQQTRILWGTSDEGTDFMRCLRGGAAAAAHFATDLAAADRLAASTPAIAPMSAASHGAAEVALRQRFIDLANNGCDSCGGTRLTDALPVVMWRQHTYSSTPGTPIADGTVGGIDFDASYDPGTGWKVQLWAC